MRSETSQLTRYIEAACAPRMDPFWLLSITALALSSSFDLNSDLFSWMAFQERDFSRSVQWLMGHGLSHLGPELTGGGFLPGPFLTLLFAIPAWITHSPRGIHALIQLSFIASALATFFLVRKRLNRTIAYLTLGLLMTAPNFVFYAYSGWHAALILPFQILTVFLYDRYTTKKDDRWLFAIGVAVGAGMQTHLSMAFIYAALLAYLAVYHRGRIGKEVLYSVLGIASSYIYYVIVEAMTGFTNTRILFSNAGAGGGSSISGLMGRNWHEFAHAYLAFVPYHGSLSIAVLLAGLWAIYRQREEKEMRALLPFISFLLYYLALPIILGGRFARFFLMAHPAFEILLALSLYPLVRFIRSRGPYAVGLGVITAIVILSAATRHIQRYRPAGIIEHTIYYSPYRRHAVITKNILDHLRLTPEEYANRFYLFRGPRQWPFSVDFPLPSMPHYRYLYKKTPPTQPSVLKDKEVGLLLLDHRFDEAINLAHLTIRRKKANAFFTAYLYAGPYYYHQTKQYNEETEKEKEVRQWEGEPWRITRDRHSLTVEALIKRKTLRGAFRYMHRLVLHQTQEGLTGFSEIIGADLRQSQFGAQAPYFIQNPQVDLSFKKGAPKHYPIAANNLYNGIEHFSWDNVYKKYGNFKTTANIGSFYIEAPYGSSIHLPHTNLEDIISLRFYHDGYGSIPLELEDESTHPQGVTVSL